MDITSSHSLILCLFSKVIDCSLESMTYLATCSWAPMMDQGKGSPYAVGLIAHQNGLDTPVTFMPTAPVIRVSPSLLLL